MLDALLALSGSNRILELERRQKNIAIEGDFDGSVTGSWVRLGSMGEGIVSYNNKEYATRPIGFISIPKGTEVELSFANGIYYSKY